jgi:hypothetical protein
MEQRSETGGGMRTLEQVAREIEEAEGQYVLLRERLKALRHERDELDIAAVADNPLLGKEVKRTRLVGYGTKRAVTNRGTVAAYDPAKHRGLRGVGRTYGIKAGDLIVLHPGGQTGWKFYEYDWNARALRSDWELDP